MPSEKSAALLPFLKNCGVCPSGKHISTNISPGVALCFKYILSASSSLQIPVAFDFNIAMLFQTFSKQLQTTILKSVLIVFVVLVIFAIMHVQK